MLSRLTERASELRSLAVMRSTRSAVSPQDSKGSGSKGNDKSSQTITLPAISPAKMTKGRRLKVLFADGNWYPGIVSREKSERL
eukprot:2052330-Rhodomonas_salina.2